MTGEPDRVPGLQVTRAGGARDGEGAPLGKGEAFKNGNPLQNSRPLPSPQLPLSLSLSFLKVKWAQFDYLLIIVTDRLLNRIER